MAFTVSSPVQDEEERRRRMQTEFNARMQQASGQGVDALGKMQELLAADEARKYERSQDTLRREDTQAQLDIENELANEQLGLLRLRSERERAAAAAAPALAEQKAAATAAQELQRQRATTSDVDAKIRAIAEQKKLDRESAVQLERMRSGRARQPRPVSARDQAYIENLADKRDEATASTLDDVQQAEKHLGRMEKIIAGKASFNTGPLADVVAGIASTVLPDIVQKIDLGSGSLADRQVWRSNVMKDFNTILKEQSGGAVTPSEMTRALAAELQPKLDDTSFNLKAAEIMDSYRDDVARAKARLTPSTRRRSAATIDAPSASVDTADADAYFGGD